MRWVEQDNTNCVLVDEENGKVLGKIMFTGINNSRFMQSNTYYAIVNSAMIGEYLTAEFAKKAVETSSYLNQKESPIPGIKP